MWWYQYRCDRCGRQEDVTTSILARYRLDDGREVPGFDQPVWCYPCDGLRTAERLADTEQIAASIDRLKASGLGEEALEWVERLDRDPDEYLVEQLERFTAMLDWRRARTTPPRCWDCGSTNFLELTKDPDDRLETFSHPSCGGRFECRKEGHAMQMHARIMNPEGLEVIAGPGATPAE